MTVIAAYWTEKSASIGGDCGAFDVDSDLLQKSTIPKVWSGPDYLVGVAGVQRAINVGQHLYVSNPYAFAAEMMKANIEGDWVALMVCKSGVWHVDNAGSVFHFAEPYGAIGSGQAVALGALAAVHLMTPEVKTATAVNIALDAAGSHTASCIPPYKVLTQFF